MHAESPWTSEPWETRGDRFSPTLFRGPELPRFPRGRSRFRWFRRPRRGVRSGALARGAPEEGGFRATCGGSRAR